jgi:hypothetical protein
MKTFNLYIKTTLLALFLCLFSIASNADESTANAEVVTAYNSWCTAIGTAKGDASKIVKFYAPDAILLPTLSAKILVNHNGGLNAYFTKLTSYPHIQCTRNQLITQVHGDIATNSGLYTFAYSNSSGQKETIPARFTFVYKKFGDQWLIIKHHSSKSPE